MKTAVITVGKEILTGKTVNTNLTTIARKLKEIGIDVTRSFVIDDQKDAYLDILKIIDETLVIFTGGLGPTQDDITRETVFAYYQVDTEMRADVLNTVKAYFDRMHIPMKKTNEKQAIFPINSVVLDNKNGTAPGVIFEANGQIIVLLPGPPHELKPMLEDVVSYIEKKENIRVYSDGFFLVGVGESTMEEELKDFYQLYPNVTIASYASPGEIKYVFTSKKEEYMFEAMQAFKEKYQAYIFGGLEDSLEGVVIQLLEKKDQVISVAESCTGGLLASRITKVSGASKYFKESFVTYSNEAKIKRLGVRKETLLTYGAVSKETALEMALGLKRTTDADITVSITGIAGPTGGTEEKPVGLVHFGLVYHQKQMTKHRVFNGSREMIQFRATQYALNMVRKVLLGIKE